MLSQKYETLSTDNRVEVRFIWRTVLVTLNGMLIDVFLTCIDDGFYGLL